MSSTDLGSMTAHEGRSLPVWRDGLVPDGSNRRSPDATRDRAAVGSAVTSPRSTRLKICLSRPSGGLAVGLAALLAGCGGGDSTDPASGVATTSNGAGGWHSARGEDLLATSNCTACHAASEAAIARIGAAPGPRLLGKDGVGSRLSPAAIRERLGAHGGELGMRMPDLLHGLPDSEREAATEELVRFLASQGGPLGPDDGDSDGDGVPDPCDRCDDFDDTLDRDGDGIPEEDRRYSPGEFRPFHGHCGAVFDSRPQAGHRICRKTRGVERRGERADRNCDAGLF